MTSRKGRTRLSASLGALVAVWMAATPFSVDPAEGKSLHYDAAAGMRVRGGSGALDVLGDASDG